MRQKNKGIKGRRHGEKIYPDQASDNGSTLKALGTLLRHVLPTGYTQSQVFAGTPIQFLRRTAAATRRLQYQVYRHPLIASISKKANDIFTQVKLEIQELIEIECSELGLCDTKKIKFQ